MPAVLPANERERLAALRRYRLLDSKPEAAFDEVAQLAAMVCETPIALMSLVDEHRQWFKARVGLDAIETPRNLAFCAHAILGERTFTVEDATKDARFADNPLVTTDPNIRFYAGSPLVNKEGMALGTLCVIDRRPRKLSAYQMQALEVLGRQITSHMELRRTADELAAALQKVQTLQALLPMCAWCKNVRDDAGKWHPVEQFLVKQTGSKTSHGICPACSTKHG